MFKKVITLLLTSAMVLSVAVVPAYAEVGGTITKAVTSGKDANTDIRPIKVNTTVVDGNIEKTYVLYQEVNESKYGDMYISVEDMSEIVGAVDYTTNPSITIRSILAMHDKYEYYVTIDSETSKIYAVSKQVRASEGTCDYEKVAVMRPENGVLHYVVNGKTYIPFEPFANGFSLDYQFSDNFDKLRIYRDSNWDIFREMANYVEHETKQLTDAEYKYWNIAKTGTDTDDAYSIPASYHVVEGKVDKAITGTAYIQQKGNSHTYYVSISDVNKIAGADFEPLFGNNNIIIKTYKGKDKNSGYTDLCFNYGKLSSISINRVSYPKSIIDGVVAEESLIANQTEDSDAFYILAGTLYVNLDELSKITGWSIKTAEGDKALNVVVNKDTDDIFKARANEIKTIYKCNGRTFNSLAELEEFFYNSEVEIDKGSPKSVIVKIGENKMQTAYVKDDVIYIDLFNFIEKAGNQFRISPIVDEEGRNVVSVSFGLDDKWLIHTKRVDFERGNKIARVYRRYILNGSVSDFGLFSEVNIGSPLPVNVDADGNYVRLDKLCSILGIEYKYSAKNYVVDVYLNGTSTDVSSDKPDVTVDNKVTVYFTDTNQTMTEEYGICYIDENNRTLVPLRAFAETVGCEVDWIPDGQFINIKSNIDLDFYDNDTYYRNVQFQIGSHMYFIDAVTRDGKKYDQNIGQFIGSRDMDTVPIIQNDRTYIPLRYAAEALGYIVDWDEETRTANISIPRV